MHYLREQSIIDEHLTPIEFVFSIPTIWTDDALLQCFRELVDSSGFAATGTVIMEMTEGEAAAVFTAKSQDHSFEVHAILASSSVPSHLRSISNIYLGRRGFHGL